MNYDNVLFIGGMDNDNHPSFIKRGDYIYALNTVNNTKYTQGSGILSNEEGFSEFNDFLKKNPKDLILNITNIEKYLIIFSIVVDNDLNTILSRIGYIKDGIYTETINDNNSSYYINGIKSNNRLNFHIDHQIQTFARMAYNNDIVVYFVDDINPPRYLTITKDYKLPINRFKDIDIETRIFTKYDKPDIYIEDIITGGELMAGTYQFICRYKTKTERYSEWGLFSNSVYISKNNEYKYNVEGANYDYGFINKAIKLNIINLDNGYDYLEIAVVRYKGNASILEAFIFEIVNIKNLNNNLTIIFDGKKKIKDISIEELLKKNIYYELAKVIHHKDNRLFLSNLKSSQLIDLQPIANDLIIQWESYSEYYLQYVYTNYDNHSNLFDIGNNLGDIGKIGLQDELYLSKGFKGFNREEVYSIGIVGITESGEETFAFHVPAKKPSQIDDSVSDIWTPYNKYPTDKENPEIGKANKIKAHAISDYESHFGQHNSHEYGYLGVYFSEYEYKDKGIYFDIKGNDLYGKRIRHWLMPSYRQTPHFSMVADEDQLQLKPLHLFIRNEHLLELYNKHKDLFKKIKKFVLVRQKRNTPTNRGIYYMGLVNPLLIQDGFSKQHEGYTLQRTHIARTYYITPSPARLEPETAKRGKSAMVSPFHGNTYIYDEDKVCFYNGRFTYEWLYRAFDKNQINFNKSFNYDYTPSNLLSLQDIDTNSYYEHILRHSKITRGSIDIQLLSNEKVNPNDASRAYIILDPTPITIDPNDSSFSHFGFITLYKKDTGSAQNIFEQESDEYSAANKAKWYNRFAYRNKSIDFFMRNNSILFNRNQILSAPYEHCPLWYGKYTTYLNYDYHIIDVGLIPHLYAWSGITSEKEGLKNFAFYSPETLFYDNIYIPINSKIKPVLEVYCYPYRVNNPEYRKTRDNTLVTLSNGDLGFIKNDPFLDLNEFENLSRDLRSPYFHIHHNWFFLGCHFTNQRFLKMINLYPLPSEDEIDEYIEYNDYEFNFYNRTNLFYNTYKNYDKKLWADVQFTQFVETNDIIKTPQDYTEKLKYYVYETLIKINNYDGERYFLISSNNEILLPELQTTYYVMLGNTCEYDSSFSSKQYTIYNKKGNLRAQGINNIIMNNLTNFPNHILDWGCYTSNFANPSTMNIDLKPLNSLIINYPVYFELDRRIHFGISRDVNEHIYNRKVSNRYIYTIDSQNKTQYGQLENSEYIPFHIIYNDLDYEIKDKTNSSVEIDTLSNNHKSNTTVSLKNGDVYVSMFYYRNSNRIPFFYEYQEHKGYGGYGRIKTREGMELRSGNYIPIESEVNCFFRHRPIIKDSDGNTLGYGVRYYPICDEREALNPESEEASNVNYNPQYSFESDKKIFYLYPRNIEFQEYFKNRIIYSEQHLEGSVKDYLIEFEPNSFQDIPKNKGEITNLFTNGNNMYAQTSISLYMLFVNPYEVVNENLILTTSGVFQRPPIELQTGISNSGGTMHKFSGINTELGYFFVDYYSKKVFLFGQTIEEISSYGMKNFFNNVLNFDSSIMHNLSNPNGVGIYSIYDKSNKRILLTIKYGKDIDKYYTISFSLLNKKWISFHSYKISVGDEFNNSFVLTENSRLNNKLLLGHGGEYGTYFSNNNLFIIEYVFNKDFHIMKVFDNILLDLEIYNIDREYLQNILTNEKIKEKIAYEFFDSMVCYTSYQNTDNIDLVLYNPNDINSEEIFSNVKFYNNQYNIKLQKNVVYDSEKFIFDNSNFVYYNHLNRLKDKYICIKFIYRQRKNLLFLLKQSILKYRINIR